MNNDSFARAIARMQQQDADTAECLRKFTDAQTAIQKSQDNTRLIISLLYGTATT